MADYPFRFYGVAPADWYEGALCGHSWEICFNKELGEAELRRLANELNRWLSVYSSIDGCCGESLVVGRWLLLTFGEEEADEDDEYGDYNDPSAYWEDVESLFSHIHDSLAIEEVHFLGCREPGYDPWSEWSVAEKQLPGPAPVWFSGIADISFYGAGMERFEAEPRSVELRSFLAVSDEVANEIAEASPGAREGLRFVTSDVEKFTAPLPFFKEVVDNAHGTLWSRPLGENKFFALEQSGAQYQAYLVDSKGKHKLPIPPAPTFKYEVIDNFRRMIICSGKEIFEVKAEGPKTQALMKARSKPDNIAMSDGLFLVHRIIKKKPIIEVFKRQTKGWKRAFEIPAGFKFEFFAASLSRPLLILQKHESDPVLYFAISEAGLHILGKSQKPVRSIFEEDGRVFVFSRKKKDDFLREFESDGVYYKLSTKKGTLWELVELDAALDDLNEALSSLQELDLERFPSLD